MSDLRLCMCGDATCPLEHGHADLGRNLDHLPYHDDAAPKTVRCDGCGHDYGHHDERSGVCCAPGCLCEVFSAAPAAAPGTAAPSRHIDAVMCAWEAAFGYAMNLTPDEQATWDAALRDAFSVLPGAAAPATPDRAEVILEIRRAIPFEFWGRGSKWEDGTDPYYTGGQTALKCVHSILDRLEEMPDAQRIAALAGAPGRAAPTDPMLAEPTAPPARKCAECRKIAAERADDYHPDSDVGPWDDACPACGHLHPNCSTCNGLPLRDWPDGGASEGVSGPEPTSAYRPASSVGERCRICGADAVRKVEEVIFDDDPQPIRHPLTAYLCAAHFGQVMSGVSGPEQGAAGGPDDVRELATRRIEGVMRASGLEALGCNVRALAERCAAAALAALRSEQGAAGGARPATLPQRS